MRRNSTGRGARPLVERLEDRSVPAVVTITTTADDLTPNDGSVSLREAITAVNAGNDLGDPDITNQNPGTFGTSDTINFNITGTGVSSQVLTARDQSGDITLVFTAVPRQVRISDSSGNVKLVLPPGPTHYRISASSSSGQTSINVPQSATSPHVVSVTDQSGNITITR